MSVKTFLPRTLAVAMISASVLLAPIVVAGPKAVPFSATLTIQETLTFVGAPPCALTGHILGAGHASHLGKVTSESVDCINPIPPDFTKFFFASSQVTLVGANGDEIWASYSGTTTVDGVIIGTYVIQGGTGRFSGAVGEGTVSGVEDLSGGSHATGTIQLTGTISY